MYQFYNRGKKLVEMCRSSNDEKENKKPFKINQLQSASNSNREFQINQSPETTKLSPLISNQSFQYIQVGKTTPPAAPPLRISNQPILLNQWPEISRSTPQISKYIRAHYTRQYSLDLKQFNEFQTSDSDFINKTLSEKNWERTLMPVNVLPKQQDLPEMEYNPINLICTEEMPLSVNALNFDDSSDFDSDDSVKDKDYLPPTDTSEVSSDSEDHCNQSITNLASQFISLPILPQREEILKIGLNVTPDSRKEVYNVSVELEEQTQKVTTKFDSLVSLSRKAINKILQQKIVHKQHKEAETNTKTTGDNSDQEEVVLYIIVEEESAPSQGDNVVDDMENETRQKDNIERQKVIREEYAVLSKETDKEENQEEENVLNEGNEKMYTKSGQLRKRKRYSTSFAERKLSKINKYIEEHSVKSGCTNKCLKKFNIKFSEENRNTINNYYWSLSWREQRVFLKQSACLATPKRKITSVPKRHPRRTFYFKFNEEKTEVCKCFFLTTLGYKSSNDKILYHALNSKDINDMRGKHASSSFINREPIIQHIQSFHPKISHYRRDHAPNRKYLPSDLSAKLMYENFKEQNPEIKISYDLYRKEIKSLNISFAQLGHEECEICEAHEIHCKSENHYKDNIPTDCEICTQFSSHKLRSVKARKLYMKHKNEINNDPNHIYFSTDLEKVIMLPRLETLKEVFFCQRLVAYNQTFAPVGKSDKKTFAVLWHEAIAGRKQNDIISAFSGFLKHCRDYDIIDLWLDNCGAQNKNWLLFFYLTHMVNSDELRIKQINLNYFEPGHTFMSCDHFHHQVELSMKRKKKLHDFQDFVEVVSAANSGKVNVKEMKISDFLDVCDYTSSRRIQMSSPRAYMRNMVQVTFQRGTFDLSYKTDLDGDTFRVCYLKDTYLKPKNGSHKNNKKRRFTEEIE